MNERSETNRAVASVPVAIGIAMIIGAVVLAVFIAPKVIRKRQNDQRAQRVQQGIQSITDRAEDDVLVEKLDSVEREIESLKSDDEKRDAAERAGRRPSTLFLDKASSAEKMATLRSRLADLMRQREERRARAVEDDSEGDGSFLGALASSRLLWAILPFAILCVFLFRVALTDDLPDRNPLSLTDDVKRSVIFGTALSLSAIVGLCIFVLILSVW